MRSKNRRNPLGTYVVTHANPKRNPVGDVDDLVLFATNDGDLYRQSATPIIENLAKKMAAGKFDAALSLKAWGYLVENAARKYAFEVMRKHKPGTTSWYQQGVDGNGLFPKPVRDVAARAIAAHYEEDVEGRAADLLAAKKAKAKKNPARPARRNPVEGVKAGDYRPRVKEGNFYKKGHDVLRVDDVGYLRRGSRLSPGDWAVVFLGTLTAVPKAGPSPYAQAAHHEMAPYEIERAGYRKVKAETLNDNWRAFFARHKP